ncbi:MAG: hypothetical protein ACOYOQ_15055, partial [Microthrixaceae bacterium]
RQVNGRFCPGCGAEVTAASEQTTVRPADSGAPASPQVGSSAGEPTAAQPTVQPSYAAPPGDAGGYPPPGPAAAAPASYPPPGYAAPPPGEKKNTGLVALVAGLSVAVVAAIVVIAFLATGKNSDSTSTGAAAAGASSSTTPTTAGSAGLDNNTAPPPPPPAPPTTISPALGQAAQLIATSSQARGLVSNAVSGWDGRTNCDSYSVIADLNQAANIRRDISNRLRGGFAFPAEYLPMFEALAQSMERSIDFDDAYIQFVRGGYCGAPYGYYKSQFDSLNSAATNKKREFINQWNPVAQQYGLPTFSEESI